MSDSSSGGQSESWRPLFPPEEVTQIHEDDNEDRIAVFTVFHAPSEEALSCQQELSARKPCVPDWTSGRQTCRRPIVPWLRSPCHSVQELGRRERSRFSQK